MIDAFSPPAIAKGATCTYRWRAGWDEHELRLMPVPGTAGRPYLFGAETRDAGRGPRLPHLATPVTQALWAHVMGANPVRRTARSCTPSKRLMGRHYGPGGFLERINSSPILAAVAGGDDGAVPAALRNRVGVRGARRTALDR